METKYTVKPTVNEIFKNINGGMAQKIHASLILIIPTIALLFALIQIAFYQVAFWQIALMLSFWFVTILGITVGFHRMLSHRAFKTNRYLKALLTILGSMAAQGPPIYWVSNHRRHHKFSDKEGDPHSPNIKGKQKLNRLKGFFHAHVQWSFSHDITNTIAFSKDLLQDPTISWINRHYYKWILLSLFLPGIIGFYITSTIEGFYLGLLWGTGVRFFITYHATNAINSVTHLWGYRNYELDNTSRNNIFLALPTLGEGWHNNHHACPSSAYFDFLWWEFDIGGWFIRLLDKLGLAWDIRKPHETILVKKKINDKNFVKSNVSKNEMGDQ